MPSEVRRPLRPSRRPSPGPPAADEIAAHIPSGDRAAPVGTLPSAAWSGCRPVFLMFSRACRILVRAHGSVAPGSSCPGGDWHSSPECSRLRLSLTSLSQYRPPQPHWPLAVSRTAERFGWSVPPCGHSSPSSTAGAVAPPGAAILALRSLPPTFPVWGFHSQPIAFQL